MAEETMVFLPAGLSADEAGEAGENQALAEEQAEQQRAQQTRESVFQRELNRRLQAKKLEKAKGAVEKIAGVDSLAAKIKQAKQLVSFIKIGSAATLVGIIITFLVMNIQLILWGVKGLPFSGFAGGKIKLPLSMIEFLVLLLVWLVIFAAIIILIILVYIEAECNPFERTRMLIGIFKC